MRDRTFALTDLVRDSLQQYEVTSSGCWRWTGRLMPSGYGVLKIGGHTWMAHRAVFTVAIGPIEPGLELDHLCRTRACVNPAHLEPVTHRENILRGDTGPARNAAKTHCIHGHEFSEANTRISEGKRKCRTCERRIKAAASRKRRVA